MSNGVPKLAGDASDQAIAVHAFMVSRGLTMRGWASRAGLSRNLLVELFSGRTRSLTHASLEKLAEAVGVEISAIVGHVHADLPDRWVKISDVHAAVVAWAERRRGDDPEKIAQEIINALPHR